LYASTGIHLLGVVPSGIHLLGAINFALCIRGTCGPFFRVPTVGEVHILSVGSGSVHKSIDGSLCPVKITLLLKITSHFSLSNTSLHPVLHRGWIPISNATFNDGTICPVTIVGRPGILMSQTCVDTTFLPSGKLMVSGSVAMHLLSTSAPSMMKMEVAPVLAMAWFVAIVIAFKYCGIGLPNNIRAAMAIVRRAFMATRRVVETLDVATVTSLSSILTGVDVGLGSRGVVYAEIKLLHLFARPNLSATHRQVFLLPEGKTDLCIPFVHGSYPAAMNCCALLRVYDTW
jgi:hypothetical protein